MRRQNLQAQDGTFSPGVQQPSGRGGASADSLISSLEDSATVPDIAKQGSMRSSGFNSRISSAGGGSRRTGPVRGPVRGPVSAASDAGVATVAAAAQRARVARNMRERLRKDRLDAYMMRTGGGAAAQASPSRVNGLQVGIRQIESTTESTAKSATEHTLTAALFGCARARNVASGGAGTVRGSVPGP
jgi:hypothetical protein